MVRGLTLAPPDLPRKHGKRAFVMDRARLVLFALRDRGVKASREIDAAKRARLAQD